MKMEMIIETLQNDKGLVKGEAEETIVLKAKIRKASYTSEEDGENLKFGTGDPWGRVTLRSLDLALFSREGLGELQPGDKIVVTVEKKGRK